MKKVAILFLLIITYYLLSTQFTQAETIGLATTENIFDIALFPGESYSGQLTVFNQSESLALPVSVKLNLWDLREDSDDIEFIIAEEALNATKWFSFESGTDFLLGPRDTADEDKTVKFTIAPPQDTPPGSYFVIMRYEAVIPPYYFTEDGPRTIPEVGVLFFIKVGNLSLGTEKADYGADITELGPKDINPIPLAAKILPKAEAGVFENVVSKMTASIKNTGIYHFTTEGNIEIKNMFGNTIAQAELPAKIMMPDRERSFDIEVLKDQTFWQKNFRIGFYTAKMTLNLPVLPEANPGGFVSGSTVVKTTTFWVFPWKFIGALIVVLFFITEFRRRIFKAMRVLVRGKVGN